MYAECGFLLRGQRPAKPRVLLSGEMTSHLASEAAFQLERGPLHQRKDSGQQHAALQLGWQPLQKRNGLEADSGGRSGGLDSRIEVCQLRLPSPRQGGV